MRHDSVRGIGAGGQGGASVRFHTGRMMAEELVAQLREAFGWGGDVVVCAGPRGALGQVWRVETGSARYALKEIFAGPPSEAVIGAELAFARRAATAGV